MKTKLLSLLITTIAFCNILTAQTTLSSGDIAFIALNSDGSVDDFSFILLTDIETGTQINFTDCGWNDGSGFVVQSGDDGYFTWTATSAMSAGNIVRIVTDNGNTTPPTASTGSTSGSAMLISYIGDQIFAFQGGFNVSASFIAGIHYNYVSGTTNNSNWDGSCYSNSTSALPNTLTNGVNAVWVYGAGPTEMDNFIYDCSTTSGDADVVRAAINNVGNWSSNASTTYTQSPFPCSFSITSCVDPDIPTLTASPTSVCPGSSTTLNITGNLNDATHWSVYTGSCGGSLVGTTSTSTFVVSPSSATTYYIRGEGGCVTPGSCGTKTISVNPTYDLSETDAVCSGDSYTFPDGTTQNNITAQVIHTSNLTTTLGCDSIIQTTVNVNPTYDLSENDAVCSGESYTFPDGTTQNNITAQVIHTSNLTTTLGCDSIIQTTVNVNPTYDLSENDAVCSGESYTFPDGTTQNNITAQVIHTSNLTTTLGCDSIIQTTVNVNPTYDLSENDAVCSGESYTFPDGTTQNNITAQVIHTSNLTTTLGCDSIIQTTVNVNPTYDLSETDAVCSGDSYTFPDGTTQNNITAQVIHTSNLTTTLGCDSIIQTTVNVNPTYDLSENDAVCSGESYTFPDGTTQNNITAQVIHTSNLTTTLGCDSIIQTTVNVNPTYDLSENDAVCSGESYTFPDGTTQNNITAQVIHTSNLTTTLGCDSIIQTTVNVNPTYDLSENDAVCSGESYTFPDGTTQNNITAQVIHTSNLTTTLGCDSIIQTTVNVNPTYDLSETDAVCSGESYTFPDGTTQNNITAQVIHTSNLTTTLGCDSIIQTTVNVNPTYDLSETDAVCSGESYTFPDGTTQNNITAQVIHTSNLMTTLGCDSIIQTTVNVNPTYDLSENDAVCSGESYTFPDGTTQNNITAQVIHTSNLTTTLGCDSIIQTTVNVNPTYDLSENDAVCSGESYTFPDGTTQNNITAQVIHTSNLTTTLGCDSIIQTTVNVNPTYDLSENDAVCSGESYTFPDGTTQNNITAQVVHTSNLTTTEGCDSIITTTVDVNPTYDLSETDAVCSGGSYTFPDGTTEENITAQVVHTSNLTTTLGCDSIIVTTVDVIEIDNSIEQNNFTLSATQNNADYQWVDCNNEFAIIPDETNQTFTPSEDGNYGVLISSDGCTVQSECINVVGVNIAEHKHNADISLYPNPTSGSINIDLCERKKSLIIKIYDITGKTISSKNYSDTNHIELTIDEIAGLYFVEVNIEGKLSVYKVIKE